MADNSPAIVGQPVSPTARGNTGADGGHNADRHNADRPTALRRGPPLGTVYDALCL